MKQFVQKSKRSSTQPSSPRPPESSTGDGHVPVTAPLETTNNIHYAVVESLAKNTLSYMQVKSTDIASFDLLLTPEGGAQVLYIPTVPQPSLLDINALKPDKQTTSP